MNFKIYIHDICKISALGTAMLYKIRKLKRLIYWLTI